jgi:hypothetical protein
MRIKGLTIAFLLLLPSTSLLRGQDFSRYRNFSFGTSVAQVSKQTGERPTDIHVINQSPALIQELTWWPLKSVGSARQGGSVREILFSFYNDKLYRILITYDDLATKGLTAEDMARAISAQYGAATPSTAEINFPTNTYPKAETVIDRWEDAKYSVNLFRFSLANGFGLLMFTKQVDTEAGIAIAEAVVQANEHASQEDAQRLKKETDDLETARQKNTKSFHP